MEMMTVISSVSGDGSKSISKNIRYIMNAVEYFSWGKKHKGYFFVFDPFTYYMLYFYFKFILIFLCLEDCGTHTQTPTHKRMGVREIGCTWVRSCK